MRHAVMVLVLLAAVQALFAAGVIINSSVNYLQYALLTRSAYEANIENQIAVVKVTETFRNNMGNNMAPRYFFPTPDGASATQLRWFSNGMWFEAIISPNPPNPPGGPSSFPQNFLNYIGGFPVVFDFITVLAPNDTMTVELTYVQLLPYLNGNVDLVMRNNITPVQSAALLSQEVFIHLESERTITGFQMLSHPGATVSNDGETAEAHFQLFNAYANNDYHLRYTLSSTQLGLWGLSTYLPSVPDTWGRGFFTFIVEPDPSDNTQIINKVFTLIIDRSGSMSGDKIIQARNAANYIVDNLNEGDMFNIIIFNHNVQSLWTSHHPFTDPNQTGAHSFINSIIAEGNTNISGAFDMAVPQFVNTSENTANIIIFLTDGMPTSGITNTQMLISHIDNLIDTNEAPIYLFTFGIGSYVNTQLLTQIANHNDGMSTFLGNSELYSVLTDFYNMIRNPVILDPVFSVSPAQAVHEVYPVNLPNLYLGRQMIVSGRYFNPQDVTVSFSGHAYNQQVTYQYPLSLSETEDTQLQFLPKIWAKQCIETLLIQYYSLDPNSPEALELKQTIIDLSITWGVITPFTSFSGGTDNDDEINGETPGIEISRLTNLPNPFNPTTTISFNVEKDFNEEAVIRIFNAKGQLVKTLKIRVTRKGTYSITWDGKDEMGKVMPSGVYIYSLSLGRSVLVNKMTMLK